MCIRDRTTRSPGCSELPRFPVPPAGTARLGPLLDDERQCMAMRGMGALPFYGGCGFRVWAPHAQGVSVMGDFHGWSGDAHWLTREGGGHWYGEVPGAKIGDQYKYVLYTPAGIFDKICLLYTSD